MKIEIDFKDLADIFEYDCVTEEEFVTELRDMAVEQCSERLYRELVGDGMYGSVAEEASRLVKDRQQEIIDRVIDRVSDTISRKKAIVSEMPKKYEIDGVNKEWESYFSGLIDKAIAKRFR